MADLAPTRFVLDGRPMWRFADGTLLPVVAGADGSGDPPDPNPDPDPDNKPDDDETIDWKAMARKHEREAKKTAAELERVRKANQSEHEKALDEAKNEGRRSALTEAGQRLAAAEIRAALTGVVPDPKAIVEDLNLLKYVTEDGEVDEDAVKVLREKFASLGGKKKTSSFDGGAKDGDTPKGGSFLAQALANRGR